MGKFFYKHKDNINFNNQQKNFLVIVKYFSYLCKIHIMIKEFKNEYSWLSNFAPVKIELDGMEFPSVEHAYMSAKSDDAEWKRFCSNPVNKAYQVKRQSRNIMLKDNWNDIRLDVMKKCVSQKFSKEPYRTKLMETGDIHIQEGNWWGDKFWGVCLKTNKGENNLGKTIMDVRETLLKNNIYE